MSLISLLLYKVYSLFFCLRYLPFRQAVYIPILIHPSVKIDKLTRGAIKFSGKLKPSMLVYGFKGTIGVSNCQSMISIAKGAEFVVGRGVTMIQGTRLVISKGVVSIGNNYCCNGDCYFNCTKNIIIGNDNICGWNTNFNTSDGHHVYENGIQKTMEGDIVVGNHVWIASHCIIAKNTYIAENSVVAQHSLVTKRFVTPNSLIGGMPAQVIKENYSWKG
jgi:acetyltransferase-like isoleucine patch superfamily enzyme